MPAFQWLLVLGVWLLAGVIWCVFFAVFGLRYEVASDSEEIPGKGFEKVQNDLASAA